LPVRDSRVIRRNAVPELGTLHVLEDPGVSDWCRVSGLYDRVTVPSFHLAGWNDIFVQGSLDGYMAMAGLGRPARLLVGPWAHQLPTEDPVGEQVFGIRAGRVGIPAHPQGDATDVLLTWMREQLSDDPSPGDTPPVRIFVMGRNKWRDEESWPLSRAELQRWFLGPGGHLSPHPPTSGAEPTRFTYDPSDPAPTIGGHIVMAPGFRPGPHNQNALEARDDVVLFTSEPLAHDLEVTGRVAVVVHTKSSAPSTDWIARLCDVHPDGRSFNVCDGITRLQQDADGAAEIAIDLWSTSNVFLAGHRLRVHVTSSSFPRWDRNLNTADPLATRGEAALQTIFHDSGRASWIDLPVIP
jgi:putative CocE/NonD family hydrolase